MDTLSFFIIQRNKHSLYRPVSKTLRTAIRLLHRQDYSLNRLFHLDHAWLLVHRGHEQEPEHQHQRLPIRLPRHVFLPRCHCFQQTASTHQSSSQPTRPLNVLRGSSGDLLCRPLGSSDKHEQSLQPDLHVHLLQLRRRAESIQCPAEMHRVQPHCVLQLQACQVVPLL